MTHSPFVLPALLPALLLALVFQVPAALAGLPEEDLLLVSDAMALGVAEDGSLINGALDLGLLWDPDGPEGEIPVCGDLLWPGRPWELWSATWESGGRANSVVNGEPYLSGDVSFEWDGPFFSDAWTWLAGRAELDGLRVSTWIAVGLHDPLIRMDLRFEALEAITDLAVARVVDPDPDAAWGSYRSSNRVGEGVVSASGTHDDRALALSVLSGEGGICSWCDTPDEVLAASTTESEADAQLGMAVLPGALAAGEILDIAFVYAFAVGADAAEALALEAAGSDDADGDGLSRADGDCEDFDAEVGEGARERWNGQDDDCDGLVDEGTEGVDDDGDGFTEVEGDCDDDDGRVHPGATPVSGVADADCDGWTDDGAWPPDPDTAIDVFEPGLGDTGASREKGGCASSSGRGSPLLALASLLLLWRRRPRREPPSRPMLLAMLPLLVGCGVKGGVGDDTGGALARVRFHLESPEGCVLDPKLGEAPSLLVRAVADELPAGESCDVRYEARDARGRSRSWAEGWLSDDAGAETRFDGRMDDGLPFDPGPLRIEARALCPSGAEASAILDLFIARLGVVAVDFQDGGDSGQVTLAYHKLDALRGGLSVLDDALAEYRAPSPGGYLLSDLDENDGLAREALPPWTNPDAPPWGAGEPDAFPANVPAAYVVGSRPRVEATLGSLAVSPSLGVVLPAIPEGSPPIRVACEDLERVTGSASQFLGAPLPTRLGRQDLELRWRFEALDGDLWTPVPGVFTTRHRLYLLAGQPALRDGTSEGASPPYPWIGVLEDLDAVLSGSEPDAASVLDALRTDLHYDGWIRYDPSDSSYSDYEGSYIYWESITSDLAAWLDRADGISLYCHSFSCLLSTLAGNVGVEAPQLVLGVGFTTNYMKSAGTDSWTRWGFNSHSVVSPDGGDTIWDPSSNLDGDDDPSSMPIVELEPLGLPGDEYLWRLTYDAISIVNSGLCYIDLP